MEKIEKEYDVKRDGSVIAIRIYYEELCSPWAELVLAFGGRRTICWTDIRQRNTYTPGITGYTLFYDERDKRPFDEW